MEGGLTHTGTHHNFFDCRYGRVRFILCRASTIHRIISSVVIFSKTEVDGVLAQGHLRFHKQTYTESVGYH